jgi:hypothetical protein
MTEEVKPITCEICMLSGDEVIMTSSNSLRCPTCRAFLHIDCLNASRRGKNEHAEQINASMVIHYASQASIRSFLRHFITLQDLSPEETRLDHNRSLAKYFADILFAKTVQDVGDFSVENFEGDEEMHTREIILETLKRIFTIGLSSRESPEYTVMRELCIMHAGPVQREEGQAENECPHCRAKVKTIKPTVIIIHDDDLEERRPAKRERV